MAAYGTKLVGGVTPGKGGTKFDGIPVFDSVRKAVDETGANASTIFVPASFARDAILEALDADIKVVVAITEGIPINESVKIINYLKTMKATLIGPNCPGLVTVDECKMGIMPAHIFKKGQVGVISRSGTICYELIQQLSQAGVGQTTCIGIGGDPVIGSTFSDLVKLFAKDSETKALVLVGEIGGSEEENVAPLIKEHGIPAVAFICGKTAPKGKRMGHAGAIVSGNKGTAETKVKAFRDNGIPVPDTIEEIPVLLKEMLGL